MGWGLGFYRVRGFGFIGFGLASALNEFLDPMGSRTVLITSCHILSDSALTLNDKMFSSITEILTYFLM